MLKTLKKVGKTMDLHLAKKLWINTYPNNYRSTLSQKNNGSTLSQKKTMDLHLAKKKLWIYT